MEDINLHFTGDMHALGAANNLLAAMTDNHVYQGNALGLDVRTIAHKRCLDMNDRALRDTTIGLGGKANGYPRESGFQITVASEVMAILCLSESLGELKERLGRIVVGQTVKGQPITASDLGAHGAMAALLRDAIKPNLVQTLEGTPALVHGGPFGNIAHGCSSVLGTKLALRLGDYVVTEAGFGSDLGFDKFCDIVAAPRMPALSPECRRADCDSPGAEDARRGPQNAARQRRRGGCEARPSEPRPARGECRADRRSRRRHRQHVCLRYSRRSGGCGHALPRKRLARRRQ